MGFGSEVIVGVTGAMGSGKSTACRFLHDRLGFHWIEGDAIVHELYSAGQPGYNKIQEYFGKQFVGKKEVNRGRLRQFVLKTQHKLWILNQIIHPLVFHIVNKKIVQLEKEARKKGEGRPKICIEAVYFEPQDLGKFIDVLLVIDVPEEVLLKRLHERKIPLPQLKKMLTFQRKILPQAGIRITNSGTIKTLCQTLNRLSDSKFMRK